jgi:hypothetical protein
MAILTEETTMETIARLVQEDPAEVRIECALLRDALQNLLGYPPAARGRGSPEKAYVRWDDIEYGREVLRQTSTRRVQPPARVNP